MRLSLSPLAASCCLALALASSAISTGIDQSQVDTTTVIGRVEVCDNDQNSCQAAQGVRVYAVPIEESVRQNSAIFNTLLENALNKLKSCPRAKTEPDGQFFFTGIKRGSYRFIAALKGYRQTSPRTGWAASLAIAADTVNVEPVPIKYGRISSKKSQSGGSHEGKGDSASVVRLVLVRNKATADHQYQPLGKLEVDGVIVTPKGKDETAVKGAFVTIYVQDKDEKVIEACSGSTEASGAFKVSVPDKDAKNHHFILTAIHPEYEMFLVELEYAEVGDSSNKKPSLFGVDAEENKIRLVPKHQTRSSGPFLVRALEASRRFAFQPDLMQALPLPGFRTFDSLALLLPGVLPPPPTLGTDGPGVSSGVGTAGQFSVNGLPSRENSFAIDGADNNDETTGARRQGFVALAPQSIETLQEFQVISALGDSRYGRNIGGQINALSSKGAQQYHLSAYGFVSDQRFNARNFFDPKVAHGRIPLRTEGGDPVLLDGQPLVANEPSGNHPWTRTMTGMTIGGPLKPQVSTFFASFEREQIQASQVAHFAVPTVKQRGIFESGETGFLSRGSSLYPDSIPGDAIFSLYPFPNNPAGPYGPNTYSSVLPASGHGLHFSMDLEHEFGRPNPSRGKARPWRFFRNGDTLTGRYNLSDESRILPVTSRALFSSLQPMVRTQSAAFYYDRHLSPNMADTIRFSFGRTALSFSEVRDTFLSPSSLPDPFLLNAPLFLNVSSGAATQFQSPGAQFQSLGYQSLSKTEQITGPLGQVIVPGFSPIGVDADSFPQSRANNTFQVGEVLTYVRGQHVFIGGFDLRKILINDTLDRNFRPIASFNGLLNQTGNEIGGLRGSSGTSLTQSILSGPTLVAAGVPTGLFQTFAVNPDSEIGIRYTQVSFFFQDQFRVTPRMFRMTLPLTVTAGLRWEFNNTPETVGNRLENALDRDQLRRDAESVECSACMNLVGGLLAAFPADFKLSFDTDRNHMDPRIGFALDLSGKHSLSIRGGFGLYTGQFPGIVIDQSRNAFPAFMSLNLANSSPRFGNTTYLFNLSNRTVQDQLVAASGLGQNVTIPGTLNALTPEFNPIKLLGNLLFNVTDFSIDRTNPTLDLVLPEKGLKDPYAYHYGLSLEWKPLKSTWIGISYVGTRGLRLLRVTTPDLGLDRNRVRFHQKSPIESLASTSFPFFNAFLRSAQETRIASVFTIAHSFFENSAASSYNSIQVEIHRDYSHGVQMGLAFTYSHCIDDASDIFDSAGSFALPQNSIALSERGSSSFDIRLRTVAHFVWDVPFGKQTLLGGWRLSGILTAQSGPPYTVNSAVDVNRDGNLTDRLNSTSGLLFGSADRRTLLQLAPGTNPVNLLAPDGSDGALGRNTFRAPGALTLDLSLMKTFALAERHQISIRAEAFNVFNRANFGIPVRILESPGFGTSVSTTTPARIIQFALKYSF
jgi:hypothetical protein